MPALGPPAALARLRTLYRDAHRCQPADNTALLRWARHPEHWAESQIRYSNWSYFAAEAVVRQCRILLKRAILGAELEAGADPFDPLNPCPEGRCDA